MKTVKTTIALLVLAGLASCGSSPAADPGVSYLPPSSSGAGSVIIDQK